MCLSLIITIYEILIQNTIESKVLTANLFHLLSIMKILCITDIHGRWNILTGLSHLIEEVDVVIVCGDFITFIPFFSKNPEKSIGDSILRKSKSLITTIGNHDRSIVDKYLKTENISVNGKGLQVDKIGFFGSGGTPPTFLRMPGERKDHIMQSNLEQSYEQIKHAPFKVLVSHSPPYNTVVDLAFGKIHIGSHVIRDFIDKYNPQLCLCGHVHEASAIDKINSCTIVNPGPMKKGHYALIDFDGQSFDVQLSVAR